MNELGISRQALYKVKRFQEGKCINCGKDRKDSPYKRLCARCMERIRHNAEKRLHMKPWKKGKRGRPRLV